YYLLENEIAPMFFERRENAGREWMRRMKQSLMHLSPQFAARRMVKDYVTQLYQPAHASYAALRSGNFENARDRARGNVRVGQVWDRVRIVEASPAPLGAVTSGKSIHVRAAVEMAGLKPGDVRVEAVLGRIGTSGTLEDTEVVVLPPTEEKASVAVFE